VRMSAEPYKLGRKKVQPSRFVSSHTHTHTVCIYIHLGSFEMWCWRRMEKISWTDHVRNEEVLLRVKEQRNILHEIRKRKANWMGHILRRNCLLKRGY
jgi:hypothetical protein